MFNVCGSAREMEGQQKPAAHISRRVNLKIDRTTKA